ncbi:MAG: T9SS type A sorting domain-containing protein [Bacteroidia bacterium]
MVTVTDNIGCLVTDTATVLDDAPAFACVHNVQCMWHLQEGNCYHIAGLSGLSFNWSTGSTNAGVDSLCPGTYTVTITDSLGCISTGSTDILVQPVILNFTSSSPTCHGLCDGTASINPVGNPPFQWMWSTGDTTSLSLSGLCAGSYSVNVSDSSGCTGSQSFVFTDPAPINYGTTTIDATCAGLCDGQATIFASGNGTLSYLWNTNPVQTDSAATGLCYGFTSFTITDTNNCSVTDSVLIFEPFPITIGNNILPVSCTGDCDGFIRAIPSGGTPAYSYLWSTGTTFDSVINLCAGTYTVTVTDANLCTSSATYTLGDPDPIAITFNVTNASCASCNDGAVTASATGGTPPYDYLYTSLSVFDSTATNLLTGYYELCVQDLHNCIQCDSVFIDVSTGINVLSSSVDDIRIYPNPFTDFAYIKISSDKAVSSSLKFYDVTGREIGLPVTQLSKSEGQQLYRIDNHHLKPGLYYVRVFSDNEIIGVGKFIIQ